ncbi:alpha/beta hydrolase family protein [Horticoccus sp. 23ND18S-11]|uniref:alpha/beta hydrolase family protein n=1 Tax=Horticoccus sp. 23ND18S-11 TaxID=3391832 RepID=UPI0039C98DDD
MIIASTRFAFRSVIALIGALALNVAAQSNDPKEIPIPPIATPLANLPGPGALPERREMPDVLVRNDGTRVTARSEWPARRTEILRTLEYYAVGQAPAAPGNVRGRVVKEQLLADGKFTYRLVHLTFGPGEKLSFDVGIFTPAGPGPFPVVIAPTGTPPGATPLPRLPNGPTQGRGVNVLYVVGGGEPSVASASNAAVGGDPKLAPAAPAPTKGGGRGGPVDPERLAATNAALARGYAYVVFNNNDCGEDTTLRNVDGSWAFRTTRFFPAYPGYDWGLLRSWAWGVSRIVDYLVTDPAIDRARIIITGASRTGKSAMVAAAFDDRIALGAPVVTGGGGVGAFRFAGPRRSETLDVMVTKYPNWFSPHLHAFRGQREKLPFDQHWFLAACAPRAFIALEGDADTISLPEAVRQSILGAKPAYALFDATHRLGVNYAPHGHTFNADDWSALLDFADRHLGGKPITRRFDRFPTAAELDAALARPPAAK